jgi:putative lipoprotein
MKNTFLLFLTLVLGLTACASEETNNESPENPNVETPVEEAPVVETGQTTLQGVISHRDTNTIPPSANIFMQLVDITDGVEAATLVEDYVFEAGQSEIPIPFYIRYQEEDIQADRKYALRAEVKFTSLSLYRTAAPVPVLNGNPTQNIALILVKSTKK